MISPTRYPLASVVVLSWNGRQHLESCLPSICAQTYPNREIILVDNGSTDQTADWVQATFPEVEVARLESNRGVPGGLNHGIRQARGEYIGLINNDTEADPEWLGESVRALERQTEAGAAASRIRLFYRRTHLDTVGDIYFRTGHVAKRGWLCADGPEYDTPAWVFGVCGGAAVYRRTMLDEIGLYDEDYQAGLDDLDLSFRGQLMGYRYLYVPSAVIYHKVGATLGVKRANPEHQFRLHRNLWVTRIKNLPLALWARYLGPIIFAEILVMGSALLNGRFGVVLRARLEVLRLLPRTLRKRREIQRQRRVSVAYLDSIIAKGWFSDRLKTRERERTTQIHAGPEHTEA